jgi:hypothetical protein
MCPASLGLVFYLSFFNNSTKCAILKDQKTDLFGIDIVETGTKLCQKTAKEFPRSTVFAGKLSFQREKFYHKILHNQTAFAIQRNLHWNEITTVILPTRLDV